jgi:hypothetical protein
MVLMERQVAHQLCWSLIHDPTCVQALPHRTYESVHNKIKRVYASIEQQVGWVSQCKMSAVVVAACHL